MKILTVFYIFILNSADKSSLNSEQRNLPFDPITEAKQVYTKPYMKSKIAKKYK